MKKSITLLLIAALLLCGITALSEEDDLSVIVSPLMTSSIGLTRSEILESAATRALFALCAYMDADMDSEELETANFIFQHPTYVGTLDDDGLMVSGTDGSLILNLFYWENTGVLMYGTLDLGLEDGIGADYVLEYAVRETCDKVYEVTTDELSDVVDLVSEALDAA